MYNNNNIIHSNNNYHGVVTATEIGIIHVY